MRIVAIALGVLAMPVAAFAAGTTAETAGPSGPAGRIADAFVELGMSDNRAACYGGVIQENLGPDAANEAAAIVEAAQTSEEVRAGVQQSTGETINAFMMAQDQCGGGS